MINYVQNNTSLGSQNYLQQQAVTTRVPEEIRTNNAEQVSLRNVEQSSGADKAKNLEQKTAAENAKANQEETKETGKEPAKALIPPPPTRFQLKVKESTEKVNKTQQAVTQFFLTAATITTRQDAGAMEDNQARTGQRSSVDVVA